MKICPQCKREFEDSLKYCTEDHTELLDAEAAAAAEADDTATAAEEVDPTAGNKADEDDAEETPAAAATAAAGAGAGAEASSKPEGMSAVAKGLLVLGVIFIIGGALVFWNAKIAKGNVAKFNEITEQEIQLLLADANPMLLKRLEEDPELRKEQLKQLKQLLAVASQAKKEGLADQHDIRIELENIADEILARNYDEKINKKDEGAMPPFGYIGEDRVKEFWGEDDTAAAEETEKPAEEEKDPAADKKENEADKTEENAAAEKKTEADKKSDKGFFTTVFSDADVRVREAKFEEFLEAKLNLIRENNPQAADRQPSDEELKQIRDYFAKVQIYAEEAREKMASGELGEEFERRVELQTKLQQANLLAGLYAREMAKKAEVTDEEIDQYIAANPDIDPKTKKAKAEEILKRAQGGEDFGKLADEFSQDPGNTGPDGKKKGGLYENVPLGRMVPAFEKAALALEPGKIAPELVETQFGYHIIKLDRKGETKDERGQVSESYDVRHILIGTGVKDPDNPMSREMPVRDMVRAKLVKEKQEKLLDEILENNPVEVPEDFKVPEVSEEELKKMQEKMMQQQMPQQMPPPAPESEPEKKEDK